MADLGDIKKQVQDEVGTTATEENFFPELNFSTFLLSLSTSAMVSLGELPDPIKNENAVNLMLARQTITIIEILKQKTMGNLTPEEDRLIDGILYDLHIKYVRAAK
ncbi:MAG: DUF1844 domain-containing protein [Syntrophorhabdaceae bacterium]